MLSVTVFVKVVGWDQIVTSHVLQVNLVKAVWGFAVALMERAILS